MKICISCQQEKELSEFTRSSLNIGGYTGKCKQCEKTYRRSYQGKLSKMYASQRANSKRRRHSPPTYSKKEFISWAEQQGYKDLYDKWVATHYIRRTAPSADRLDDDLPYTLANLQLGTWGQNDDKAHEDFKTGKLLSTHTAIQQFTKAGAIVTTHYSQNAAHRATGISQGNIGLVCRGIRKTAGGFMWRYVNEN